MNNKRYIDKPTLDEWMACTPINPDNLPQDAITFTNKPEAFVFDPNTAPDATNNIIAMDGMNTHAIEHGLDHLSPEEMNTLRALHARGWAVCAFAPWEMNGAEQEQIEDAMAEAGWDAIDFYGERK